MALRLEATPSESNKLAQCWEKHAETLTVAWMDSCWGLSKARRMDSSCAESERACPWKERQTERTSRANARDGPSREIALERSWVLKRPGPLWAGSEREKAMACRLARATESVTALW